MKKFVSLFLCLSLIGFAVARAMTPGHTLAGVAKTAQKKPTPKLYWTTRARRWLR
jgi:hypothetical protein